MIISVTDRRQETQFSDRKTRRGPSTFGKALNVKDYGTRLWSRTSRNNTSIDFAKKKTLMRDIAQSSTCFKRPLKIIKLLIRSSSCQFRLKLFSISDNIIARCQSYGVKSVQHEISRRQILL